MDIRDCRAFLSQNSSWYRSQWTGGLWGNTYPSTSVPHGSLGSCTMDPGPFRKLLSTLPDYSGVEEFTGRNALQSVLPPDSIKMGLSDCVLIVDSLGTE